MPKEGDPRFAVQFHQDVNGLLRTLKEQTQQAASFEGWKIVDTDDFYDLSRCGTDIEGSCQRIDGDPRLNKCLLGYIQDGKNRMLAIKDGSGKIKARAILRLLWDPVSEQPIIFLERIYPQLIKDEYKKALIELALSRAHTLDLPLLSKEEGSGEDYRGAIVSLGSRAPYGYVDAGGGVHKNGKFTIANAHYLSIREFAD